MFRALSALRIALSASAFVLLVACGGGGGGGGGSDKPKPPTGSMAIADVDADNDGLIEIATLQQLDWMHNDLAGKSLTDKDAQANSSGCPASGCFGYELVADLDFDTNGDGVIDNRDTYFDHEGNGGNAGWIPIGGKYPFFSAQFEGNGHVIRNLYINRPQEEYVGLFGLVDASIRPITLRNVVLEGASMSVTGKQYVGGLSGFVSIQSSGDAKAFAAEHCRVAGKVSGYRSVGGLFGHVEGGGVGTTLTLEGNVSSTAVTGEYMLAGGLVGWLFIMNGPTVTIVDNSATGAVAAPSSTGGMFGSYSGGANAAVLKDNFTTGSVTGGAASGGLIGSLSVAGSMDVENCFASGNIEAFGGESGGLLGNVEVGGRLSIKSSHASGDVAGDARSGGLIGVISGRWSDAGNTDIQASYATGAVGVAMPSVHSFFLGGLIGTIESTSIRVAGSYAAGNVRGNYGVGGLIGHIDDDGRPAVIAVENTYASGSVTGLDEVGGLIGEVVSYQSSTLSVVNNLAVGNVTGSDAINPFVQGVIGSVSNGPNLVVRDIRANYFASDTTGQTSGTPIFVASDEMTAALLAELQCPIAASDTGCAADELYSHWDLAIDAAGKAWWDFGSTAQLPGLRIGDSIYRPAYDAGEFTVSKESL